MWAFRSPDHGLWAVQLSKTLKTEETAQLNWAFLKEKKGLGLLSQKKKKTRRKRLTLGLWKKAKITTNNRNSCVNALFIAPEFTMMTDRCLEEDGLESITWCAGDEGTQGVTGSDAIWPNSTSLVKFHE